jgi:hypothetical protein
MRRGVSVAARMTRLIATRETRLRLSHETETGRGAGIGAAPGASSLIGCFRIYPAASEKTCPAPGGRGLTAHVLPRSLE